MPHTSIYIEEEWGLPYPEGSEYEGNVERPEEGTEAYNLGLGGTELPNGKGTLTTSDGQTYSGELS
jgi:hypothetical protein